MTEGRTPCIVIGCRRTRRSLGVGHEWICGQHWRAVPRPMRQRLFRLRRRRDRMFTRGYPSTNTARACAAQWEVCKARAIEVAMGISA